MNGCVVLRKEEDQNRILSWWNSFQLRKSGLGPSRSGWRAELRRAESPTDVLLSQGFRALYLDMTGTWWSKEENLLGLAAVAGIVVHIDVNDDSHSFAESCALLREGSDNPRVSEMRFAQLQKSRTLDELFTRMRRTIQLLRRKTSVVSTADSVLHWYRERRAERRKRQTARSGSGSLGVGLLSATSTLRK